MVWYEFSAVPSSGLDLREVKGAGRRLAPRLAPGPTLLVGIILAKRALLRSDTSLASESSYIGGNRASYDTKPSSTRWIA